MTRGRPGSIRLFSGAGVTDGSVKRLTRYEGHLERRHPESSYFGRGEGVAVAAEGAAQSGGGARLLEMYRRWAGTRKILRKLSEDCETFCSTGW